LQVHHRWGQAPLADLEEGTLRKRQFGLGQLRALRGNSFGFASFSRGVQTRTPARL